jgi:hypothetical protein
VQSTLKAFASNSDGNTTVNWTLSDCDHDHYDYNASTNSVPSATPLSYSNAPTTESTWDTGTTDASGAYSIGSENWPIAPANTQWLTVRVAVSPTFEIFTEAVSAPTTAQATTADAATFVYPPPADRAPVNFTFHIPHRQRALMDKLNYSVATAAVKTPAEIETIFEQNADALGVVVTKYDGSGNVTVYGAPMTNTASIATQNLPHTGTLLPAGSEFPTGYRMASTVTATAANVIDRIEHAYNFLDNLYAGLVTKDTGNVAKNVVKEYPSIPLWTSRVDQPSDSTFPRLLGHYYNNRWTTKTMWVAWAAEGQDWDTHTIRANPPGTWSGSGDSPFVLIDRYFDITGGLGRTEYLIMPLTYANTTATEDLWLGDTFMTHLGQNGQAINPAYPDSVTFTCDSTWDCPSYPSHRYTIRHATAAGRYSFAINGETVKSYNLGRTVTDNGFGADLRDPLYGRSAWRADDFIYSTDVYHDCYLGIAGQTGTPGLPWGRVNNSSGDPLYTLYGYESKVCNATAAYILTTKQDPGSWGIQAIHILNKYNDPDHAFTDPKTGGSITPRQMARRIESADWWTGIGVHGYLKSAEYASGYRTMILLELETLLGYKYGDTTSQTWADKIANIMMEIQAGTQTGASFKVETWDHGLITRPIYTGAPMLGWRLGHSLDFGLPTSGVFQDLIDVFNMPNETAISAVIGNSETTEDYIQALRVYLQYKYGQTYGGKVLTPRADIPLPGNTTANTVKWVVSLDTEPTNWKASDVLNHIDSTTSANIIQVQRWWEGAVYTCCIGAACPANSCPSTPNGSYWNFPLVKGMALLLILEAGSPATTWRPPGAPMNDSPVTYHLYKNADNMIGFPAVNLPAVAMNSQELLDGIRAACGSQAKLFRNSTTLPYNWVEFVSGTTPWMVEKNLGYLVSLSMTSTTDCYYTP